MWVVAVVVIIMILAGGASAAYLQGRTLNRQLVDAYLGDVATNIGVSAVNEAYHRLYRHTLTPEVDPKAIHNWEWVMVSMPGKRPPSQVIDPIASRFYFQDPAYATPEYTVEEITDVTMTLVDWAWNVTYGFWSGVMEFNVLVRVRLGSFPAGIAVTRRVRIRKRYYATQSSAYNSPSLQYLAEDVTREVSRSP